MYVLYTVYNIQHRNKIKARLMDNVISFEAIIKYDFVSKMRKNYTESKKNKNESSCRLMLRIWFLYQKQQVK